MSHELNLGAGEGAPAAPPAAPGSGVSAPPAAGAPAGSPPAGTIDWNTAPQQLRDAFQRTQTEYQRTKAERDQYAQLGSHTDVSRSHQTYTKMFTEANTLGTGLGYDAQEVLEAFQTDPVNTLATLRQMARDAQTQPANVQGLTPAEVKRMLQQELKPFQQEREQRMDSEAESRFDGEFGRLFTTSFPNGLPDSNKEAISGLAWQLLIDNKDAYGALRAKGDTSSVAGAFEQAKKLFLKIITDYGEHEKKRIGGEPPVPSNGTGSKGNAKPLSFQEIAARYNDDSIPLDQVLRR